MPSRAAAGIEHAFLLLLKTESGSYLWGRGHFRGSSQDRAVGWFVTNSPGDADESSSKVICYNCPSSASNAGRKLLPEKSLKAGDAELTVNSLVTRLAPEQAGNPCGASFENCAPLIPGVFEMYWEVGGGAFRLAQVLWRARNDVFASTRSSTTPRSPISQGSFMGRSTPTCLPDRGWRLGSPTGQAAGGGFVRAQEQTESNAHVFADILMHRWFR